jgi:hypothetical protein
MSQQPFQVRVRDWAIRCFGKQIAADRPTRVQRFLEEALELAQSCSMSYSDVTTLVNYVYGRPHGVPAEEGPQVLLTLAALAEAYGFDLVARADEELDRVNRPEVMERIQAKQASKPYNSPLPGTPDLGKIASGLGKSGKLSPLTAKAFANASRIMKDVPPLPTLDLPPDGVSMHEHTEQRNKEVKDESPKSSGE